MIDAELATEYVNTSLELLDSEDKVHKLIHDAGDASAVRDWKHWNPDEIPSILEVLRLDKWTNGKAIAAALKEWSEKRYAAHKKYRRTDGLCRAPGVPQDPEARSARPRIDLRTGRPISAPAPVCEGGRATAAADEDKRSISGIPAPPHSLA